MTPFHPVVLRGRCSINGGADVSCVVTRLKQDGLLTSCDEAASFADKVIFHLARVGIVESVVKRVFSGGFEVAFEPAPQSKLGIYVSWLTDPTQKSVDHRAFERIVPLKKLVTLRKCGSEDSLARIIDISRSGIAFTTSKPLREGEAIVVGPYQGKVIRLFDGGAAVQFDTAIEEDGFGPMIDLHEAPVGKEEPTLPA